MIICVNCQHKEMNGAIYCSNCGAMFMNLAFSTQRIRNDQTHQEIKREINQIHASQNNNLQTRISLNLIEQGQVLLLADRSEFTLGRSAEDQPIVPDVDLSQYDAYSNGVSRLHAVIKVIRDKIVIMDLGSSNGTFVNGIRLPENVENNLSHGDIILLGKLKMQVSI